MLQSLTRLYSHLIFSTKNCEPFLNAEIRPRVHGYVATVIHDLDSPWVVVGGVSDHGYGRLPIPRGPVWV